MLSADGTDRPVRGDPFAGGMGQGWWSSWIRPLPGRLRCVCTVAISCWPRPCGRSRGPRPERHSGRFAQPLAWAASMVAIERLLRVAPASPGLGQGGGDGADRLTGAVHGCLPSSSRSKLIAPDFDRLARIRGRSLPWHPPAPAFQLRLGVVVLLIGPRVCGRGAANSAQALEALISTIGPPPAAAGAARRRTGVASSPLFTQRQNFFSAVTAGAGTADRHGW